ncbi:cache domain-containing protein, partial [Burkholderia gladioli]|nr:cache domain-containing protein [Burkholderia gladioli]
MRTLTLNRKLTSMIAILWIGLLLIAGFGAWHARQSMLEARRAALASLVSEAYGVAEHYYQLAQQHTLPEDEAKQRALDAIAAMRYGSDGYISINDSQPAMIMHPIKPALNGTNLANFADPNGAHLFVDIVKAGKEGGEGSSAPGYVHYLWPKPGADAPVEKTSVVRRFAPWDWFLVTGMYMDDIRAAMYRDILIWLAVSGALGIVASLPRRGHVGRLPGQRGRLRSAFRALPHVRGDLVHAGGGLDQGRRLLLGTLREIGV